MEKAMAGNLETLTNRMVGADGLLGQEIVDLEGRPIGQLHDIVFDLASGRIAHVFIAMNQPRYADQCVLAPWDALHVESDTRRLRINVRTQAHERVPPAPEEPVADRFAND